MKYNITGFTQDIIKYSKPSDIKNTIVWLDRIDQV